MKEIDMARQHGHNMEVEFIDNKDAFNIGYKSFLAGLKAGRPKWHKVIDGFMPPIEKGNDTINVLTDKGDIAYYSYNFDCWVAEPSSIEIDPPIAWCEIPKFEEEQI
jgi:hypothetical protein